MGFHLPAATFRPMIEDPPLVSLDLLVVDRLLVGKRVDEPARGFFFVPAGGSAVDENTRPHLGCLGTARTG